MREEYDFEAMPPPKRGPVVKAPGKSRITIMLDDDVLDHFRSQSGGRSPGYQTLINAALREHIERKTLEETLRRVVREELTATD